MSLCISWWLSLSFWSFSMKMFFPMHQWCQINFQRMFHFKICVTDHLDFLLYWPSTFRFPQKLWPIYLSWTRSSRVHIYQSTRRMISCIVFTWYIPPLIDLTIFMNLLETVGNKYLKLLCCISYISKYHFAFRPKCFLQAANIQFFHEELCHLYE